MEILVNPIEIMPCDCDDEGGSVSGGICWSRPCDTRIPCGNFD